MTFAALVATSLTSQAIVITHTAADDAMLRASQPTTLQTGRNIYGAQGSLGSQFVTLQRFSLADLSTDSGGGPIVITSVSLNSGTAISYSGVNTSGSFTLRAYTAFDSADATWNNPDGSAGLDPVAGGTLGTLLATETFSVSNTEGSFIFNSTPALVAFVQNAYDNNQDVNFRLGLDLTQSSIPNSIPRTDFGSNTGEGTGLLDIQYTAIPEPSSTALLGLAGLALVLRRRK